MDQLIFPALCVKPSRGMIARKQFRLEKPLIGSIAIESCGVRARSRGIALGLNAQLARSGTHEAVNDVTESYQYSQTGK
jgi:hypothetical protein